jgi:hypothetical protein
MGTRLLGLRAGEGLRIFRGVLARVMSDEGASVGREKSGALRRIESYLLIVPSSSTARRCVLSGCVSMSKWPLP